MHEMAKVTNSIFTQEIPMDLLLKSPLRIDVYCFKPSLFRWVENREVPKASEPRTKYACGHAPAHSKSSGPSKILHCRLIHRIGKLESNSGYLSLLSAERSADAPESRWRRSPTSWQPSQRVRFTSLLNFSLPRLKRQVWKNISSCLSLSLSLSFTDLSRALPIYRLVWAGCHRLSDPFS
jgi:hypothetical protein